MLDNRSGQQRNFIVPLLVKLNNGSGQLHCSVGLAAESKAETRVDRSTVCKGSGRTHTEP